MTQQRIGTVTSAGASSYTFTAASGRSDLLPSTDRVIKRIDSVSAENLPLASSFSGSTRILMYRGRGRSDGWRGNVRKLAMLARLQPGWDYPDSQPMDRAAEANYLDWLGGVSAGRMADAEPLLTDEGHIRLEWQRDGYFFIAEIGPDSLYLASLAPNRADDDSEEFDRFDAARLTGFFDRGILR